MSRTGFLKGEIVFVDRTGGTGTALSTSDRIARLEVGKGLSVIRAFHIAELLRI